MAPASSFCFTVAVSMSEVSCVGYTPCVGSSFPVVYELNGSLDFEQIKLELTVRNQWTYIRSTIKLKNELSLPAACCY